MFAGWFPGALDWVAREQGRVITMDCGEEQCAAEAGAEHCLFRVRAVHP